MCTQTFYKVLRSRVSRLTWSVAFMPQRIGGRIDRLCVCITKILMNVARKVDDQ